MLEETSTTVTHANAEEPQHFLPTRAVLALIASMLLVGTSFGAVAPLVSAILENRGFSEYFTGGVTAILSLAIALSSTAVGKAVERHGTRMINLIGILGQAAGFAGLGIALATHEYLLLPVRFGLGIAATMTFVAAEVALLRGVAARVRGRVMAAYGAALAVGFMLGVFASNWAYDWVGLWCFGLVAAIALLIAPLAWFGLANEARNASEVHPHNHDRASRLELDWRPLRLGLFGAVVFGALDTAVSGVYPVEAQRIGFQRSEALHIIGRMALGLVLGHPLAGWLADKYGVRLPLVLMSVFGIACSFAAGHISQTLQHAGRESITLAYFGIGIAVGGIYPISLKLLADRATPAALPHVNARFSGFYGYSALIGPILAAVAIDVMESFGILGWAIPGLCGITLLLFLFLIRLDRGWSA
ncbi:MAG: MFS transporter [bacterium]